LSAKHFDQKKYWQSRVSGNIDLGVVGYRSLGRGYNEYIYRRRLDVLEKFLGECSKTVEELRVLDVGCGSGFYVDYWRKRGVTHLTGVDISPDSVVLMQKKYPEYSFAVVDATMPDAFTTLGGTYDIVTIFDVIYHVIDDFQAAQLLMNALSVTAQDGNVLLTDTLGDGNYGFVSHVRFRSIGFYEDLLQSANFMSLERLPLFNLLQPPIVRRIGFDYIISGLYYLAGYFYRAHNSIGGLFGSLFYHIDRLFFKFGLSLPNQELLVISRIGR
jgi:SAM-dependent methyltransferase